MTRVPSTTFSGGVIGEGLYGRVDLNKYQTGLKKADNMIISVEGGVQKRFGTYFIGKRKFQDKASRLKKWKIGPQDSYMLEFGDKYIRFIRLGGYVAIPGGHVPIAGNNAANVGGYMEITTPYLAEDLKALKFNSANDVLYITHPSYPPKQLRRLGLYDWNFADMNFSPHPAGPTLTSVVWINNLVPADNYTPEPVPTFYMVSATMADGTETIASGPWGVNADTAHRRLWVEINWNPVGGAVQYTIYKGKNGIYGFIGYTTGTNYADRNYAPAYDTVPLSKELTFPAGEYPAVSAFYKQRMAYGRVKSQPQALWFSKPMIFTSLRTSIPSQDDDAIKATLVGETSHTINHLMQLKKFIVFSDTSEWVITTENNQALTTATLNPVIETSYGSDPNLVPMAIGERILFIQNITGAVLDMGYEYTSDAFKADELTRLVRDLFKKKRIEAWDYAAFPFNILPCVLNDGSVNVMTYVREHEIWGWSTMSTQGKYLDFAAVPEFDHDGMYYQVERVVGGVKTYFIERTEVNFNEHIDDMVYLDCAITYKSFLPYTAINIINEDLLTVTVPGNTYAVGNELQIEDADFNKLRITVTNVVGSVVTGTPARQKFPEEFSATGNVFRCVSTITGIDHLEGQEVTVLGDGKVVSELTVVGGAINLPFRVARAHVGLSFEAEIQTLDIDDPRAVGQYRFRAVNSVIINLLNSRGVYAGSSHSDQPLSVIEPRNTENMFEANEPLNGPYEIPSHVAWEMNCGVTVRSIDPLPLNVLNIVPDVEYGY